MDRAKAVRMVAAGKSYAEVADYYGVTRSTIAGLCYRAGLRTGPRPVYSYSAATKRRAVAMVAKGLSLRAISAKLGVTSSQSVLDWARAAGVKTLRRKGQKFLPKQSRPARGGAGRLGSMGQSP